jgi:hypothetical protein
MAMTALERQISDANTEGMALMMPTLEDRARRVSKFGDGSNGIGTVSAHSAEAQAGFRNQRLTNREDRIAILAAETEGMRFQGRVRTKTA